jgi:hypothetical protein
MTELTTYHWRNGTPIPFDAFENSPGPPGPLALSAADLAAFDAQIARLKAAVLRIKHGGI